MADERKVNEPHKRRTLFLAAAFLGLWMLLIFALSAQPGRASNQLSKFLAVPIADTLQQLAWQDVRRSILVEQVNHGLRKGAHVSVYFILGYGGAWFMQKLVPPRRRWSWGVLLFFCIAFAVLDEYHQLFVAGRTGTLRDVLWDTGGAMGGMAVCWWRSRG